MTSLLGKEHLELQSRHQQRIILPTTGTSGESGGSGGERASSGRSDGERTSSGGSGRERELQTSVVAAPPEPDREAPA